MMPAETLLDTHLYVRGANVNVESIYTLLQHPYARGHLAEELLLYDAVILASHDMGILPILAHWLGAERLIDALQAGAVRLIRIAGGLAYAGAGNGLVAFTLQQGTSLVWTWHHRAAYGATDEAVDLQLRHVAPSLSRSERSRLADAALARTITVALDGNFIQRFKEQIYRTIVDSPNLTSRLYKLAEEAGHPIGKPLELTRLPGVSSNQIRMHPRDQDRDAVDWLLRMADSGLQLELAELSSRADLHTTSLVADVVREAVGRSQEGLRERVLSLFELTGVPDIRQLVANANLAVEDIWELRNSRDAIEFRKWLRAADQGSSRELEKAYAAVIGSTKHRFQAPVRILRFLTTIGVGLVDPIAGIAAAGADSFLLDKWLSGYSPRLLIDKLRLLANNDGDPSHATAAGA